MDEKKYIEFGINHDIIPEISLSTDDAKNLINSENSLSFLEALKLLFDVKVK